MRQTKSLLAILIILLPGILLAGKKSKAVILYQKSITINSIVKDGLTNKLGKMKLIDMDTDSSKLSSFNEKDYSLVISIGKVASDFAIKNCKKTPVVFTLVSAPKYFYYNTHDNVTGVSTDVHAKEFYKILKKILKPYSRIGFIYKSNVSEYLTSEVDFIENRYSLKSVKAKVDSRSDLGKSLKDMIVNKKIKAFWMLTDPLYNAKIFSKLSKLCKKKGILLITPFEPLVTQAGAAFAIAPSYFELGIQSAELAEQILQGTSPTELPIQYPRRTGVYINDTTISELGIKLPKALRNRRKITALFEKGQKLLKKGKLRAALKAFKKVLKLDKKHTGAYFLKTKIASKAWLNKANTYLDKGRIKKAIPLLIKAAKVLPEARYKLTSMRSKLKPQIKKLIRNGKKYYKKKNYGSCISNMNLILSIDPSNQIAKTYLKKAWKKKKALSALQ